MRQESKIHATPGRYLIFYLREELYAVPIQSVSEIIGFTEITNVPQTPEFVKGVINLRGKVIPVLDLRKKFDISLKDRTRETCIIILEAWNKLVGAVVDKVQEVVDLVQNQIEPSPELGNKIKTKFIMGMGKVDKDVIILLNIEEVLSEEEMDNIKDMANDDEKTAVA